MVNWESLKQGDIVWCDISSAHDPVECVVDFFDKTTVTMTRKDGKSRATRKLTKVFYTKEEWKPY